MSKINWNLVDRDIFAEYRLASTDEIVQAYVTEARLDEPNDTRLITLYEMGQGRFSSQNNREQRVALFTQMVHATFYAAA